MRTIQDFVLYCVTQALDDDYWLFLVNMKQLDCFFFLNLLILLPRPSQWCLVDSIRQRVLLEDTQPMTSYRINTEHFFEICFKFPIGECCQHVTLKTLILLLCIYSLIARRKANLCFILPIPASLQKTTNHTNNRNLQHSAAASSCLKACSPLW